MTLKTDLTETDDVIVVRSHDYQLIDFDNPRSLEKKLSGIELHRKLLLLTKKY